MLRIQDGGRLSLIVENAAENRNAHWRTLSPLSSNPWHHVAGTWQNLNGDRTDAKIYLDGVEQGIEMTHNQGCDSTFLPGYTTAPLFIGREKMPSGRVWGLVDEVEVFEGVLITAEIQAISNAGSTGKCKGAIDLAIDIKPGTFPNSINLRSRQSIRVAILSAAAFDATTVDPSTVRFGVTGIEAAPMHATLQDVDSDGDTDLVLQFATRATGIRCRDTSASLTGETFDRQAIQGVIPSRAWDASDLPPVSAGVRRKHGRQVRATLLGLADVISASHTGFLPTAGVLHRRAGASTLRPAHGITVPFG